MSRCVLDNEDTGHEVVVGWDSMLNTFFCQVIQPGEDEPSIWMGTVPNEYPVPDALMKAILPFACSCDQGVLRSNLLADQKNDAERIYSIAGNTVW